MTLVELIISVTIIGIMATAGVSGYLNSLKNSRDAKRKLDVDTIRNALELYRGNRSDSAYPTTAQGLACLVGGSATPCDTKYLTLPVDPASVSPRINYAYAASPVNCDNTVIGGYCSSYTIGTVLESIPATTTCSPAFSQCTSATGSPPLVNCNYCQDPYGTK